MVHIKKIDGPFLYYLHFTKLNSTQLRERRRVTMAMDDAPRKLKLVSADTETFEVLEEIACMSQTIQNMIEDTNETVIPLPNVKGKTLAMVVEYMNSTFMFDKQIAAADAAGNMVEKNKIEEEKEQTNANFVKLPQSELFDVILASNYMNIKSLLDLTCKTVAMMIKGKTPEEIRKTFNIKNDFTPEEEEEVRRENAWAFD